MERGRQLHHDRRGNIGHHTKRDEAHALQAATRKRVENIQNAALRLAVQRLQDQRVDPGQRHKAQKPEDDQRPHGEPDTLFEIGCLAEIGKADVARDIVGA